MILRYLSTCTIVLLLITLSCSRQKTVNEGIELYQEGLYQSAFIKIKDGLIQYSMEKTLDEQSFVCTPYAVFSTETLLTMLYPKKHTYEFPREVVSVWYDPADDVCVVTDGIMVSNFSSDEEIIINNPTTKPIKAVSYCNKDIYLLCGEELYVHSQDDKKIRRLSSIDFPPPETLKYYNGYMHAVNNKLIIIVGIAGMYNAWVLSTEGEILLSRIRIASWKNILKDDMLFVITGSAGHWDLKSISITTKKDRTIKSFTKLQDVHLLNDGIIINNGDGIVVYNYDNTFYAIPFTYSILGGTNEFLLVDGGYNALISGNKFFMMIEKVVIETGCCIIKN